MKFLILFVILFTGLSIITTENAFAEKCLPIELEYTIVGGNLIELCKSDTNVQLNAKIQASDKGHLIIEIPTKVVYSLSGLNCELGELFVLMDGYEILPDNVTSDENQNIITVSFQKGNHTIAFVGSSIIPDPGPSDYCGIVKGYDSLYLPPKFQEKNGVTLKHIHCNENLKVLERFDGSAACVDYDTRTKLIERGWGKNSLYQLDDKTIIENVKDLEEVKAFLAKYPNSGYGTDRDSWQVYLLVHGIAPDESSFWQQRTKKLLVEIDPFGRPLWVGIECGGPVTLSAQTNVIELLNTPNWCFPDGNEISDKVPFGNFLSNYSVGIPSGSHAGPPDFQTEITGEDAWAICSALRIPCPSEPIFRGGKLNEFTKSVSVTTTKDLYEILLNKTHVCVTSTQAKTTDCTLR
jgi:hypothetical protein